MKRRGVIQSGLLGLLFLLIAFPVAAQTAPRLDTSDPLGFFTNLASRFLKSELDVNFSRIQVWPTNQYTPSVHRLLQVTANTLDATTNRFNDTYPYLPSVFRPRFTNDGGRIFICGYEEAGPNALTNAWRDVNLPEDRAALQATDYVYGIPLIIGAKKGFPNFNEFAMQSIFQITRRVQIKKLSLTAPRSTWETEQMFLMSVTNVIGVEAWNSYQSNFTRGVDVFLEVGLTMALTNDFGLVRTQHTDFSASLAIASNDWRGFVVGMPNSFQVLLRTNVSFLPTSIYQHGMQSFTTNFSSDFESGIGFPQPHWGLSVTSRVRFFMVDRETQRLLGFVTLDGLSGMRDLDEEIRDPDFATGFNGLWSTNLLAGGSSQGVENQVQISLGNFGGATADWNVYGINQLANGNAKNLEIDKFRVFYGLSPLFFPNLQNSNLVLQTPFTPTARTSQYLTWQANDPLVHQLESDLVKANFPGSIIVESLKVPNTTVKNIGVLNERHKPWGGNPLLPGSPDSFILAVKDPQIYNSDEWQFPSSEPLSLGLFARVHRGTPWQTIYLKSDGVTLGSWQYSVSGIDDANEARRVMPTNDWRLAAMMVSLLNTNDLRTLPGVNAATWLNFFEGMTVLTNTSTAADLLRVFPVVKFDTLTMNSNSPQVSLLVDAVAERRGVQPSGRFAGLGDVLGVPQLSTASPWLNVSSSVQLQKGISDVAYERIPVQLLSRMRPDSIGVAEPDVNGMRVRFSGIDGYSYAIETSTNFVDWSRVSTNEPVNGTFEFVTPVGVAGQFYRSVLLP